jgi:hypothetical protein
MMILEPPLTVASVVADKRAAFIDEHFGCRCCGRGCIRGGGGRDVDAIKPVSINLYFRLRSFDFGEQARAVRACRFDNSAAAHDLDSQIIERSVRLTSEFSAIRKEPGLSNNSARSGFGSQGIAGINSLFSVS